MILELTRPGFSFGSGLWGIITGCKGSGFFWLPRQPSQDDSVQQPPMRVKPPKPQTLSAKPYTLNPKPKGPGRKPQSFISAGGPKSGPPRGRDDGLQALGSDCCRLERLRVYGLGFRAWGGGALCFQYLFSSPCSFCKKSFNSWGSGSLFCLAAPSEGRVVMPREVSEA